jgi:hypothetical protein
VHSCPRSTVAMSVRWHEAQSRLRIPSATRHYLESWDDHLYRRIHTLLHCVLRFNVETSARQNIILSTSTLAKRSLHSYQHIPRSLDVGHRTVARLITPFPITARLQAKIRKPRLASHTHSPSPLLNSITATQVEHETPSAAHSSISDKCLLYTYVQFARLQDWV